MDKMAMFDDCKKGDRVWDYNFGFGEIIAIRDDGCKRPIRVKFDFVEYANDMENYYQDYSFRGRYLESINPTLFWDEVKIVPPEKPKEHEHCFDIVGRFAGERWWECECGARMIPKVECEVCNRLSLFRKNVRDSDLIGDIKFLLNQHHSEGCKHAEGCEKGGRI